MVFFILKYVNTLASESFSIRKNSNSLCKTTSAALTRGEQFFLTFIRWFSFFIVFRKWYYRLVDLVFLSEGYNWYDEPSGLCSVVYIWFFDVPQIIIFFFHYSQHKSLYDSFQPNYVKISKSKINRSKYCSFSGIFYVFKKTTTVDYTNTILFDKMLHLSIRPRFPVEIKVVCRREKEYLVK